MRRRQLLAVMSASAVSAAGCLGGTLDSDAIIAAERQSQQPSTSSVRHSELPPDEREIAAAAVESGLYHACPQLPDAVRSFALRFDDVEEASLRYQGQTYGLWIRVTDQIYAMTAPSPDNPPSCGLI